MEVPSEVPRTITNINDNYCVKNPVIKSRAMKLVLTDSQKTLNAQQNVNFSVVSPVHFATNFVRQLQKKGLSPHTENKIQIKSVNCVSFVDHCVFVPTVPNVHSVVHAPPVGGRLQPFWQTWARLGASPRVVSILQEGYVLPFKLKPPLVRHPRIVSGYASPDRNKFLREAVQTLVDKKAVKMVRVQASLAFFNRLFIVPKPKMATSLRPQCSEQIFERKNIQNGNTRDNSDFPTAGRMGDIAGFQRRLFSHSQSHRVLEISQVPFPKPVLPVQGPPLWPLNSSYGVQLRDQRGQTNGSVQGYKDPPVPRRLVDSSPYQRILSPGHPVSPRPLPGVRLGSEPSKIGVGSKTGVRVCGLQIRPLSRPSQTDLEPLGVDPSEGEHNSDQTNLSSQKFHVLDRPTHSDGKTGSSGQTSYETGSVAPKETLEGPRISREGDSNPEVPSPPPHVVDQRNKCLVRPTSAPFASCNSGLYRRLKQRLGCSLRRLHSKRHLVSSRKFLSY